MKRKLDRKVHFDERSRNFKAVEGIEDKPLRNYTWPLRKWLNQGSEGACVGFGISHELAAIPAVVEVDNDFAYKLYDRAKQLDPWEGENYDGTSVLAGMKAVQEQTNNRGKKLIEEYRWAFGIEDVVKVLGRKGPIVLGINWYNDMFDTDENGFIHKSGGIAGGHCILARGQHLIYKTPGNKKDFSNVDMDKSYIVLHNSWGRNWGTTGTAKISLTDLDALLNESGEAVIPETRNK